MGTSLAVRWSLATKNEGENRGRRHGLLGEKKAGGRSERSEIKKKIRKERTATGSSENMQRTISKRDGDSEDQRTQRLTETR